MIKWISSLVMSFEVICLCRNNDHGFVFLLYYKVIAFWILFLSFFLSFCSLKLENKMEESTILIMTLASLPTISFPPKGTLD